ncbi:MAG: hypothetical protein RLZZ326_3053, partial [Planctomycetota bacterium]
MQEWLWWALTPEQIVAKYVTRSHRGRQHGIAGDRCVAETRARVGRRRSIRPRT